MKINVNGNQIEVPDGCSVSVVNGTVTVNGAPLASGLSGTVHLKVEGGRIGKLTVPNGSVECGDVEGDVDATSVKCGDVRGNINAASVICGNVGGSIDAASVIRKG